MIDPCDRERDRELAALLEWTKHAEERMRVQDAAIESIKQDRTASLKWGIGVLGAAAMSLFGFIMMLFSDGRISK